MRFNWPSEVKVKRVERKRQNQPLQHQSADKSDSPPSNALHFGLTSSSLLPPEDSYYMSHYLRMLRDQLLQPFANTDR